MKRNTFLLMALLSLAALPVCAESMDMNMHMDSKSTAPSHQGKGTVNKVNADAGKVNITHEAIQSLDWPAMTMDFEVQEKAALSKLKPGQKVTFKLFEARKGKYVISEITAAK